MTPHQHLTPRQHAVVERTRAAMVAVRSAPTGKVHRGRAALALAKKRGTTQKAAAIAIGVTPQAVSTAKKRAELEAVLPPSIRSRAQAAARHVHDLPPTESCTRLRAARMFGVPHEAVIAAWEQLYPDEQRICVG